MTRSITLVLVLAVHATPVFCAMKDRPFIDGLEPSPPSSVEDRDSNWQEGAVTLPPWPADSDLVELGVDDPSWKFRQYIDRKHISVSRDGVVHYTLLVDSRNGARNVSFEGLRCTPSGAFKIYAYGYEGRFQKSESEWIPIRSLHDDPVHRDLHRQILCIPKKFEPRPITDMIRAMQTRIPFEANTGFLPD